MRPESFDAGHATDSARSSTPGSLSDHPDPAKFERHSELAHSDYRTIDRVNTESSSPVPFRWTEPQALFSIIFLDHEVSDLVPVSIPRLFLRLKLGMRSSASQDPLIQL